MSSVLPSGQLSNVPWRRADVKYTNNEAYFDIIEEVDAIIDKTGDYAVENVSLNSLRANEKYGPFLQEPLYSLKLLVSTFNLIH